MPPPAGFTAAQMIFQDTFNGTSLNLAKWSPALGANNQLVEQRREARQRRAGFPLVRGLMGRPPPETCELRAKSQIAVNNGLTITTVPNPNNVGGQGYQAITGTKTTTTRPHHRVWVRQPISRCLPPLECGMCRYAANAPTWPPVSNPPCGSCPPSEMPERSWTSFRAGLHPGGNANNYLLGTGFVPSVATPYVGFLKASARIPHVYGIKLVWGRHRHLLRRRHPGRLILGCRENCLRRAKIHPRQPRMAEGLEPRHRLWRRHEPIPGRRNPSLFSPLNP